MKSHFTLASLAGLIGAGVALAQPRVWIADQGNNQLGPANPNNRILEIDPVNHKDPPDAQGDVIILNTLPSPAGAFLDELKLDANRKLWCVVKDDTDQDPDGLRRIDRDTGAIDNPPGLVVVSIPGQALGGYLEGVAWDGAGLWVTSIKVGGNNMLTRVDPETGQQIAPFDTGTLGSRGYVDIPGSCAQGLLWQSGNGGHGWLWHSDALAQKIHKLDLSMLFDGNDANDDSITVVTFNLPFKPKGMDWMGEKIWVAAPATGPWNPAADAGIWEFDPATGATRQLFNTPTWNLDGLAILSEPPGPKIVLSTSTLTPTAWIGGSLDADLFTVANGGTGGTLNYDVSDNATWLGLSRESGHLNVGDAPDPVTVTYTGISSFKAGTYQAAITVESDDAFNSPQEIAVTLTVETVKPDLDGDADVDLSDFGLFQACFTAPGGPITDPSCTPADFDGDGGVSMTDLTRFMKCMTGSTVPATPTCDD